MTRTVRPRYTREFKQEAVRLMESGQRIAAAARSLEQHWLAGQPKTVTCEVFARWSNLLRACGTLRIGGRECCHDCRSSSKGSRVSTACHVRYSPDRRRRPRQ